MLLKTQGLGQRDPLWKRKCWGLSALVTYQTQFRSPCPAGCIKKEHLSSLPVPHPDHTDVLPLLSSFIQSPSFHAGARPLSAAHDDLFSSLCVLATIQLHNECFNTCLS